MLENRNPPFNPPLEAEDTITRPGGGIPVVPAASPIQFPKKTEVPVQPRPLASAPALPLPGANGNNQIDGVRTLEWIQKADKNGGWLARIDGSVFSMNPGVGSVLAALSADVGQFPDRFVSWRRKRDLAVALDLSLGALSSRIRRLRRWLDRQPGLSGDLVLSCRKRGFRFAVDRRPAAR